MLTQDKIRALAEALGVEYCAIKAVIEVETGGRPFLPDGRPLILFEGHIFWRELAKRGFDPEQLSRENPDIIYRTWTKKHYKGGAGEYERLTRATLIDREAALCSASWGLFQIMGFNCALCGEPNVEEFVQKQKDIDEQIILVANFLRQAGHVEALRNKDWVTFARRYNGAGYAANQYDLKLQKAYERCGPRS